MSSGQVHIETHCFHCGAECNTAFIRYHDLDFCCEGCRTVYAILEENRLCDYYDFDKKPGLTPEGFDQGKWAFLDNEDIIQNILQFRSTSLATITFYIPSMHCASCIYLLENLHKISEGVISSQVQFLKKEVAIKFDPRINSLRQVAELLCAIGYTPSINLNSVEHKKGKKASKAIIYKIGIAGFCFGNIMLLALPEYFDLKSLMGVDFTRTFRYLDALLSLPVLFYCASDYFRSSYYAIKTRTMNMDLPIALGISGIAVQSYYDVISGNGGGFFDSMTGLVFFLLLGKFFQQRTYDALSFDRDYKSYFPLAVTRATPGAEESINVNKLQKGDVIYIHHEELIPADSLLEMETAEIDYSFVTGESEPLTCKMGDLIYAGGRNKSGRLRMRVVQEVSQSYLTRLWNADAFKKDENAGLNEAANKLAKIFTVAVIVIAAITGVYWQIVNPAIVMRSVTAVLIVACPCVLALSIPFTFGAVHRILGRKGFYIKNAQTIEKLDSIDTIVFDKTGTLTAINSKEDNNEGQLSKYEQALIKTLASQSTHPISRAMIKELDAAAMSFPITNWEETIGQGLQGTVDGHDIKLGKASFVKGDKNSAKEEGTFVSVDGEIKGHISHESELRSDVKEIIAALAKKFRLFVLTGDGRKDQSLLSHLFQPQSLHFDQSPKEKLAFIEAEQQLGHKVLMIGDGLNDAGALMASNFGITITDDINAFSPASDAILDARQLAKLPAFTAMSRSTVRIIYGSFIFSLCYNCIGLSFAVRGELQPWVAAILMPVSSITVVLYTHIATAIAAKRNKC